MVPNHEQKGPPVKRAKLVARIEGAVTDTSVMDGMMEQLKAKKSATMGHILHR